MIGESARSRANSSRVRAESLIASITESGGKPGPFPASAGPGRPGSLDGMADCFDGLIDRFVLTSAEFQERLRQVRPDQWSLPTPCTEWTVRDLVNHMTRGNLNYVRLADGATGAEFLRSRDADALGADPVDAYARSVRDCAAAFATRDAMRRIVDYPLGRVTGRQALAVRITDSTIHTWDLARAIGADETLDAGLVGWIDEHLDDIYAGLAETPVSADSTHRFFDAPEGEPDSGASTQARLLHRMGRTPQERAGGPRP